MGDICPHCGKQGRVESLRTPARSPWRCCAGCGETWVAAPELDPFSAILASPAVFARPQPDQCPEHGAIRALRFAVRLPVHYRLAGTKQWSEGLTENISRSGVLFRVEAEAEGYSVTSEMPDQKSRMEILLHVSGQRAGDEGIDIRCEGQVVRTLLPEMPGLLPGIAVAVRHYRLQAAAA
jgi:hypothetical protein